MRMRRPDNIHPLTLDAEGCVRQTRSMSDWTWFEFKIGYQRKYKFSIGSSYQLCYTRSNVPSGGWEQMWMLAMPTAHYLVGFELEIWTNERVGLSNLFNLLKGNSCLTPLRVEQTSKWQCQNSGYFVFTAILQIYASKSQVSGGKVVTLSHVSLRSHTSCLRRKALK